MNVVQGLKRIPRIKFPQRHVNPSARFEFFVCVRSSSSRIRYWIELFVLDYFVLDLFPYELKDLNSVLALFLVMISFVDGKLHAMNFAASEGKTDTLFFSNLNVPKTMGGKASSQPKRTPVPNEEMEAILNSLELLTKGDRKKKKQGRSV
ncbi:hypothetical protein CARUB_v10007685mg [Capsella rubella]|uniref:Uncharacterized protein n=1 Tax=Capsella rubella TaxID=81985 RepID=R0GU71_9BRAS|nr:hypothetical protein CARUB_v10007685mg [Capsella rubella]